MMIVVVTIFAFCWLPFHIYFIWVSLWPEVTQTFFVREVFLGIYWLAMSNSMYNPMIYCWMNARLVKKCLATNTFAPVGITLRRQIKRSKQHSREKGRKKYVILHI
jgi:hypothetical protein